MLAIGKTFAERRDRKNARDASSALNDAGPMTPVRAAPNAAPQTRATAGDDARPAVAKRANVAA
jgi:hypothetical protein